MNALVDELEGLCSEANDVLLLVAPFVKQAVLQRLFVAASPATPIRVVTRWLPQDIASGVCDLEIWDDVSGRPNTQLLVRHDLHAKYFRADGRCLVGSANLTGRALGLSTAPNLELLVPIAASDPAAVDFENNLFSDVVTVDEEFVAAIRDLVEKLPSFAPLKAPAAATPPVPEISRDEWWIPTLRQPGDLFRAYRDDEDLLSRASLVAAMNDLAVLRIPRGLDEAGFRSFVGFALLRMPAVRAVDAFVATPRRFGEVRGFLREHQTQAREASRRWQVLFRWLMHFLPERYDYLRPRQSELIVRREASP